MIGLIDVDLFKCKVFTPNPEIMLLSSYFKKKGEIVKLLGGFNDLDYYDRIFIRKNRKSGFKIPNELYNNPKIDFGGLAFTNGVYVSLPEEVLECTPDPSIYNAFIKCKPWETRFEITQKNSLKAHFLSIHHSPVREINALRAYIIDGDLTGKDIEELNKIKMHKKGQTLYFYYPIYVDSFAEIEAIGNSTWINRRNPPKLICNFHMTEEEIKRIPKVFIRAPVKENVPLEHKLHHWEVAPLTKKVIGNTIYARLNNYPIGYQYNPKTRKSDKSEILRMAIDWSNTQVNSSFEKYCHNGKGKMAQEKCEDLMLEDSEFSYLASCNKNDLTKGGKLHYEW